MFLLVAVTARTGPRRRRIPAAARPGGVSAEVQERVRAGIHATGGSERLVEAHSARHPGPVRRPLIEDLLG